MAGALPYPAGNSALPGARRRPVRAALRHLVQHAGGGGGVRRGGEPLARAHQVRRPIVGAIPGHGHRLPVGPDHPQVRRRGLVRRPHLPHRPLAARGGGLQRAAGRDHRHRLVGGAGYSGNRRAGAPTGGVPAHRPVYRAGPQPAGRPGAGGRDQGRLRRLPRPQPAHAERPALAPPGQRPLGAGRGRRRTRAHLRAALAGGRVPVFRQLQRPHGQRTGQRRGGGVRARQDSGHRARSGCRRVAVPGPHHRLQAPGAGQRLLRSLQPRQRAAGRRAGGADPGDHAVRGAHRGRALRAGLHHLRHPGSTA